MFRVPWMEEEMNRMGTVKLVVRPAAGSTGPLPLSAIGIFRI